MLTNLPLLLCASVSAFATPTFQEDPEQQGPPLVSLDELVLQHYSPLHVELYELVELGKRMVGRSVYVKERGGYGSQAVSNLSVLGENLVLYDTEAYVAQMLASLKELDQPGSATRQGRSAPLATIEYTPSFISLDVALSALGSFQRMVSDRESSYPNISFARDRGLLVVRETKERLVEITELLERIDTPEPQMLLTCYLIRGGEKSGGGLPAELTSNLEKLVPGFSFEQVGFGMLRAGVVPGGQIALRLDTNYGENFELSFIPMAYDAKTSSLSVANCTLQKRMRTQSGAVSSVDAKTRVFSTDTLFRGNEYTVLGASGIEPIFVVVRVAPIGA